MFKDNKGSFFAFDLIIGIFIFIIAIALINNLTSDINEKVSDNLEDNHLEKISIEAIDNLINNPGSPNNWENLTNYNNVLTGLAIINNDNKTIKNSISYDKIKTLENSYDTLISKNIFNNKVKSSITLTPINSDIPQSVYGNTDESRNVYSIHRFVVCDYLLKYVIEDFNNHNCNKHHTNTSCGSFSIYNSYLENFDYYLLVDKKHVNNLYFSIDDTKNLNNDLKLINDEKTYLNNLISDNLKSNSSGIFFIHLNEDNADAVLVAIPKDIEDEYLFYDYFRLNKCELVFKTWY
ncbi:hypothetical protein [Methanobrevibacter sp. DSM 116169]|uniref:hypothetical protein n=1 Tax=Methanobrevibacter sp. DSM 116169 TaxID=3242727 RepID=UPI0038FCC7E6